MITKEVRAQIEEIVKRINGRKEHEYAGATYRDVPDLKEMMELASKNNENTKEDLTSMFAIKLFVAEKYESMGRMSVGAKYRFEALEIADELNNKYQDAEITVKYLEECFKLLLRDRNFYVDDDCEDCLKLMTHANLMDEKKVKQIYQSRMERRRNLKADPVEMSEEYLAVIDEVEKIIAEQDLNRGMGSCHAVWALKEELLAQRGINWSSPAALNPRVMFD